MLQRVISLLLQVGDEKSAPGVERLDALDSREAQGLVHSHHQKKFSDIIQSAEMGWTSAHTVNIIISLCCSHDEFSCYHGTHMVCTSYVWVQLCS